MAYLGTVPAEAYSPTAVKDSFNGDGSTVAFTMSQPSKTNDVRVVVENVVQDPTVAYSCSGTTITFTSAPPVGTANVYVVHLGLPVQSIVPPDEINIATTYTTDLTVQGAFTSVGIDDNADATAITIDSSENVLIGKTSASTSVAGIGLFDGGLGTFTRSSAQPLDLNRQTNDGDIILLRKDGTAVGSIGTQNTHLTIGKNDTGIKFQDGVDGVHPWDLTSNAARDAAIDLGYSVNRFRNLYLSGGVYLGGTGGANLLDHYEEGTWTPTVDSGTVSYTAARYLRVGDLVTVWAYNIVFSDWTSTTQVKISGLPFTSGSSSPAVGTFFARYRDNTNAIQTFIPNNAAYIRYYENSRTGGFIALSHNMFNNAANAAYITITYEAA